MSDSLVSVIIPCFNAEVYVREAIESALSQTHKHREVIVVDDGSRDSSVTIIESFGAAVRWETGPNRGAPVARNRGLELAQGEYIQFLDADDILGAEKIEKSVAILQSGEADVVFCDYREIDGDSGADIGTWSIIWDGVDPFTFLLRPNPPLQTSVPLHRKKTLTSISGFDESLSCCQDLDLHLRLAAMGARFRRLPEALFTLRRVEGSLSRRSYVCVLDQHAKVLWPVYRDLDDRGLLTDSRAKAFSALMAHSARHYLLQGEKEKANDYFHQAREMHNGGGLHAFGLLYRMAVKVLGPVATERLVNIKRRRRSRRETG